MAKRVHNHTKLQNTLHSFMQLALRLCLIQMSTGSGSFHTEHFQKQKSGGVTLGFHPVDVTTEYTVSRNHPAPKEDLGWQEKQGSVS